MTDQNGGRLRALAELIGFGGLLFGSDERPQDTGRFPTSVQPQQADTAEVIFTGSGGTGF